MKCLVCISKTADTTSKIAFDAAGKNFQEDGVQFILNPYDEWYGLVRAIELRDALGGQVDVVHVGSTSSEILIRKALAIGADMAFRLDITPLDAYQTALYIAAFAKSKNYDVIFAGKETIDYNSAEVGAMIAAELDWPLVSQCQHLETTGNKANCTCDIDGGTMELEIDFPFVITASKGLAEQKIPNMKGIIDAKKKPLEVLQVLPVESHLELVRFEMPPSKTGVQMIDPAHIEQLVDVFQNELKIV